MSTLRMTSDLRRQLILGAAKRCFARHGFAGPTTKSVAAAASISEGLLFKHFPTKSALYAEILAEECAADPDLLRLMELEHSTEMLVTLVREMIRHFREGEARRKEGGGEAMNLFWFAHHTLLMVTLTRIPTTPCLSYGEGANPERQVSEFILRGIGLNEAAITHYLDRDLARNSGQPTIAESA